MRRMGPEYSLCLGYRGAQRAWGTAGRDSARSTAGRDSARSTAGRSVPWASICSTVQYSLCVQYAWKSSTPVRSLAWRRPTPVPCVSASCHTNRAMRAGFSVRRGAVARASFANHAAPRQRVMPHDRGGRVPGPDRRGASSGGASILEAYSDNMTYILNRPKRSGSFAK